MAIQKKTWLIIILIFISGLFLRVYRLSTLPPALNWDEVSHAYNAYSLLNTGRDQWSVAFPFPNFRAYGDYPTVPNLYLTVPMIFFLGPSDFAVRFPHALIGAITGVLLYIVGRRIRPSEAYFALFTSVLCITSPWSLFPSRAVFQSNWAVLLVVLGLALYLSRRTLLAFLIFGLSLTAYHTTRIFVPLILPYFILVNRTQKRLVFTGLVVLLVSLILLLNPQVRARTSWVSILDSGAIAAIDESRNKSSWPQVLTRLVFNRPVYFVSTVVKNYVGYFSPRFLFFSGGTQYQFSLPGFGLLNPVLLPFFYLGLWYLFRHNHKLLLLWLLLSPLPAAITRDQFAVIRATCMLPAVYLTTALGLFHITHRLSTRLSYLFWSVFFLLFFSWTYYHVYFTSYSSAFARDWQYGYAQLTAFIRPVFADYDRILVTKRYGEPHEFILWNWPWDPKAFQQDPAFSYSYHDSWYWVTSFSKFIFINDWDLPSYLQTMTKGGKTLVVASPDHIPPGGILLHTIAFPDGQSAFILKEI